MNTLEQIAENLARAIGHSTDCKKLSVPCTCGSGNQQAQALHDYEDYKRMHRVEINFARCPICGQQATKVTEINESVPFGQHKEYICDKGHYWFFR